MPYCCVIDHVSGCEKVADDDNEEANLFLTPHVASTFTQQLVVFADVIEDVHSGLYSTQQMDDVPSFNLGITQDFPSSPVLQAKSPERKEVEKGKSDVGGKGKR